MKVNTSRFGEIEVNESDLLVMKGAIFGFERYSRYALLIQDKNTPLWWLQSLDDPGLAFVVADPCVVKPDYAPVINDDDLAFLNITKREDLALLAIVAVRSQPLRVTVNLRAPIMINVSDRSAGQVIVENVDYPIQYDVVGNRDAVKWDGCGKVQCKEGPGRLAAMAAAI